MTTSKPKRLSVEEEIAALDRACSDPQVGTTRDALRKALGGRQALVVARAATHARRLHFSDLCPELEQAFLRLSEAPAKSDPSCRAKAALLDALDHLESVNQDLFLAACRCEQHEPGYGAPHETAGGVRARALAALSRLGFPDFLVVAGRALADAQAPVRQAALEALAHHGARSGAGLALFKLLSGDSDPVVTLASMHSLLSLAPDWGIRTLRPMLFGKDEQLQELSALALGESRNEEALRMLFDFFQTSVTADARAVTLRAIGLSRLPEARDFLIERARTAGPVEAEAAVRALGSQRFEPGLRECVLRAVAENPQPISARIIDDAFSGS